MIIVKIDSSLLGGIYRRRDSILPADVNLRFRCNSYDTLWLIEGIGSNQSLLGDYDICDPLQGESILHCFKVKGQIIYKITQVNKCHLITTIKKTKRDLDIVIFSPNPTKGNPNTLLTWFGWSDLPVAIIISSLDAMASL